MNTRSRPSPRRELVPPYRGSLAEMIHTHDAIAHHRDHGNMQIFLERIAALASLPCIPSNSHHTGI
ncbi:MAG: hypothetical protein ACLFV5_02845 [Anaerolineales bacterium]